MLTVYVRAGSLQYYTLLEEGWHCQNIVDNMAEMVKRG